MSDHILKITRGSLSLSAEPAKGGNITSFTRQTAQGLTHIFAPATADHPASCVLAPIGNRQPCTKMVDGVLRQVGPAWGRETGNYLHGDGWHAAWAVRDHGSAHLTLAHSKKKTPLSWDSYDAEQEFRFIDDETLLIRISITNTDDYDLYAGPAHHPWFPRDEQTIVQIDAPDKKVWLFDYDMRLQPESLVDLPPLWDFNAGVRMMDPRQPTMTSVGDTFLMDSCLPNVGDIRVIQPRDQLEIHITTDSPTHAVIYNPTLDKDFCVVEAVPTIPYAEQLMQQGVSDTGATVLKKGQTQTFNTYFRIKAHKAAL